MAKVILLILLSLNFMIYIQAIKCDENTIEHCIECNSGENAGSCSKCENKYFLFFNNLICLRCNDSKYGQIACFGTCDGTNLVENRLPFCEEDGCQEGYYNLNGICMKCSYGSTGCSKCTYDPIRKDDTKRILKCLECESNQYILSEKGECKSCFKQNCEKCHYENNTEQVCDICYWNYYKGSNGEYKHCYNVSVYDEFNKTYKTGQCEICSDNITDYKSDKCWCNDGSIKTGYSSCAKCPDNCYECEYNNITKKTECIICYSNYTIDPDKNCAYCGYGCEYCSLDSNLKPICTSCLSGTILNNNQCLNCPNGCSKCKMDESSKFKNEIICTECYFNYALTPDNKCNLCINITDTGEGCNSCVYNKTTKKYDCLGCISHSVYVDNLFKCFYNTDSHQIFLYACYKAVYDEKTDQYECVQCSSNFIQPINEKVCRNRNYIPLSLNCLEIENKGTLENPIYSCHKCDDESTLITNITSGTRDCYDRDSQKYMLSYCLEGEIYKNGTMKCTKCVENSYLHNYGYCKCNSNSFGKYNKWCYKCNDKEEGNPGCLASKGCIYINGKLSCNECKESYYYKDSGQCSSCMNDITNCDKCHKEVFKLTCENCIGFNSPNENGDKCKLDECEEYPEIAPGCIICKDKLIEYKNNKKCQSCKYGYFKTKEDLCVYCRSEAYGGPFCYECGYEENEKGEETNNIICKDCYSYDKYVNNFYEDYKSKYLSSTLSPEGKCYSCQNDLSDLCLKCEYKTKLVCTLCIPGYYLDSQGNCISFLNNITIITNCQNKIFKIGDGVKFYLYDYDDNSKSMYLSINQNKFNYSEYNEILRNYNFPIKAECFKCKQGYYLNDEGKCDVPNIEIDNCTGSFMIQDYYGEHDRINICKDLCIKNGIFTYILFRNDKIAFNYDYDKFIRKIGDDLRKLDDTLNYIHKTPSNNETPNVLKATLCRPKYDEKLKMNFTNCSEIIYISKKNKYQCINCYYGYELDNVTNTCKYAPQNYSYEYEICLKDENNSCKYCYNRDYSLVTLENGLKTCKNDREI